MIDPLTKRFNATEYLKSMGPITATPVAGHVSTTQTAANLAEVRAMFGANDTVQAETTATLKALATPRINDVAAMRPEETQARLDQLTALKRVGGLGRIGANAVNGDQKTTSVETYMEWLNAKADGVVPTSPMSAPPLFDLKA